MREIKFRGKDVVGNWYIGNLAIVKHDIHNGAGTIKAGSYISNESGVPFAYQIRPETVGQFTGLHDKNGVEIYEGDKVSTDLDRPFNIVIFRAGAFRFNCNDGEEDYHDAILPSHEEGTTYSYGEVIGNIHEGETTY